VAYFTKPEGGTIYPQLDKPADGLGGYEQKPRLEGGCQTGPPCG